MKYKIDAEKLLIDYFNHTVCWIFIKWIHPWYHHPDQDTEQYQHSKSLPHLLQKGDHYIVTREYFYFYFYPYINRIKNSMYSCTYQSGLLCSPLNLWDSSISTHSFILSVNCFTVWAFHKMFIHSTISGCWIVSTLGYY